MTSRRVWHALAGLSGASAIGSGAFHAHGLGKRLTSVNGLAAGTADHDHLM
jgi:hypothetical protein